MRFKENKMQKLYVIIITGFLILGTFSCTPEKVFEDFNPQACCGEELPIPPPPRDTIPNNG